MPLGCAQPCGKIQDKSKNRIPCPYRTEEICLWRNCSKWPPYLVMDQGIRQDSVSRCSSQSLLCKRSCLASVWRTPRCFSRFFWLCVSPHLDKPRKVSWRIPGWSVGHPMFFYFNYHNVFFLTVTVWVQVHWLLIVHPQNAKCHAKRIPTFLGSCEKWRSWGWEAFTVTANFCADYLRFAGEFPKLPGVSWKWYISVGHKKMYCQKCNKNQVF